MAKKGVKFVIVTGGVCSGIGKGTAAASIGKLLSSHFKKIVPVKCDGYLNEDPGTMNPYEHGEVYVLDDGGEVDMDFGHYERFLGIECKSEWNLTSGKILKSLHEKERRGEFLGKTVQYYPHVRDEILEHIFKIAEKEEPDLMIIEIGGTVGDDENAYFIDAVNPKNIQSYKSDKFELHSDDLFYAHVTYIIDLLGQQKTKPAQNDLKLLRSKGIIPDIIIGRSKDFLTEDSKKKLANFLGTELGTIISGKDIETTIYEIPLFFMRDGFLNIATEKFKLPLTYDLARWGELVKKINKPARKINIGICGKYAELEDSYKSIKDALIHAGAHLDAKPVLHFIETSDIKEDAVANVLTDIAGIIVPGGFGARGTEGKIALIGYARKNNLPMLGICYGMQLAVIEYARNVCNLIGANTTENEPTTEHPVIDLLPEQKTIRDKGATMRRGGHNIEIKENTKAFEIYQQKLARERFRHRFEVNPIYIETLEKAGIVFSGKAPNKNIMQIMEFPNHNFFVGCQFHPEFTSRLEKPNPLFYHFLKTCLN